MKKNNIPAKNEIKKKPTPEKVWLISNFIIAGFILILYFQTLNFEFVNWDDNVNIYENQNVINYNIQGIFTNHIIGNYNPLSNLSHAIEYYLVGDKPGLYHFNNVILHIICTLLVFSFIKRLGLSITVSFIVALLFGIHPMRVESVAWITERKDVLFGTFYLASMHLYLSFLEKRKALFYYLSIFVFILSLLSKIQAVSLPLSLLLIDYWQNRKLTVKLIAEKIPFFILSTITGLAGIYFLRLYGSLDVGEIFPLFERIFIGSYSFVVYIVKSIYPYQMAAYYLMPPKLTAIYWLSIIPALAVLVFAILLRNSKKYITFGVLFFLFNIVFVLQIVGAGVGFLADRFTYIPYLGIFLILAIFFEEISINLKKSRFILYTILSVYFVIIFAQTNKQIQIWKNGETLWTHVIENEPKAVIAYNNLGLFYSTNNQPEKALKNYDYSTKLLPEQSGVYNNMGKIYFDRGDYQKALENYNLSIKTDTSNIDAIGNRGAVYAVLKENDKAIEDLSLAISRNHKKTTALSNRGFIYYQMNEFENAINDFKTYLEIKPDDVEIINLLGLSFAGKNDFDSAISEYNKAILLDPDKAICYYNRSLANNSKGDKSSALKDAQKTLNLGLNIDPLYLEMLFQNQNQAIHKE